MNTEIKFAAIDKNTNRYLGICFGYSNRTFLTKNPDTIVTGKKQFVELIANLYNSTHKQKADFEIIQL
jgi:hypothetical protein